MFEGIILINKAQANRIDNERIAVTATIEGEK
jgi:hypothetical protein